MIALITGAVLRLPVEVSRLDSRNRAGEFRVQCRVRDRELGRYYGISEHVKSPGTLHVAVRLETTHTGDTHCDRQPLRPWEMVREVFTHIANQVGQVHGVVVVVRWPAA